MTWGEQNSPKRKVFNKWTMPLDQGVNFWDTAELYSIPPRKETFGHTEVIIGNWFKKTKKRKQVILAIKSLLVLARSYVRGGGNQFHGVKNITVCIRRTVLKRLKTDYIDLYQLTLA